jgi:hypothetical protein
MNISPAVIGKNESVDIASASYKCVPTVHYGSERYTAINCSILFLHGGLRSQSLQSIVTLEIILDAWWASMSVGSRQCIASKNSRHAPLGRFYLHCGIEETGSSSIICIVCHQVLCHPLEHGTSSIGKHLMANLTSQS